MAAEAVRFVLPGVPEPFPGLRPFESGEEAIFRGRQPHVDALLRRLARNRFLAVVGTSGSGKSSLVRAGLLPALDRGYLSGATSRWRIAVMRPGVAPIENLAESLSHKEALGAADAAKLRSSSLGLVEAVREAKLAAGESLLVVADQFEELLRYQRRMVNVDGGADAALFVKLLLTASQRPDAPIYVVLTMRSDFLGDCSQFAALPEALSESQYLIPRLTREQRRQAIEEPLRLFGATMTPQLVERLLNDSGDESTDASAFSQYRGGAPDPLPVLQHALMRTYLEWKSLATEVPNGRIDLKHYENAGRMSSALDQHAESVFERELDELGRIWAERIFRCVTATEFGHPVRRPTPLADLYKVIGAREADQAKVNAVLDVFRRRTNSFLQINNDTSVDISHESLIWKWKRLSGWVARESASAELYRDLVKDVQGKGTWGEPKLSGVLTVRHRDAWNAQWAAQYSECKFEEVELFLDRSRRAVNNQKLLRWFGFAAAVAIVILGVTAYYLGRQSSLEAQKVAALKALNDGAARDLEERRRNADVQEKLIKSLNSKVGATQDDRERIAKEKSDAEARLKQYQDITQREQASLARQSTDLVASANSLQSRLDAALQARDAEGKKRFEAEAKVEQLEAKVASLTKDLDSARATIQKVEPAKDGQVHAAAGNNGHTPSQLQSGSTQSQSSGEKQRSSVVTKPVVCPSVPIQIKKHEGAKVTVPGADLSLYLAKVGNGGASSDPADLWITRSKDPSLLVNVPGSAYKLTHSTLMDNTYVEFPNLRTKSTRDINLPDGTLITIKVIKTSFINDYIRLLVCHN